MTRSDQAGTLTSVSDVLNLGCGRKTQSGALNVDIHPELGADIIHDLNRRPWPLPSDWFREVRAMDVIEHLEDVPAVMEEIHRVCRTGAKVCITVPHFSSANAFTDVTHRHYFGWFTFQYFTGGHEYAFYSQARFSAVRTTLVFHPTLLNRVVRRLANRYPAAYERRWAWIFPAWFVYVELVAVKPAATG